MKDVRSSKARIELPKGPPPADAVRHFKQQKLARRWDLSTRTLERWRVAGTGPRYLKLNGRVIYRLEDILDYEQHRIRERTEQPTPIESSLGGIIHDA